MRHFLIFGLTFLPFLLFSQTDHDTTLHKRQLDSLENEIFRLKDSARQLMYKFNALTLTQHIDITYLRGDSTEILYKNAKGKVLKRVFRHYRGADCITSETTEFMNKNELPEFIILFERPCYTKEEYEKEQVFEKLSYYYRRREYDAVGRVKIEVFWYPRVTTRKLIYIYDENGKQQVQSERIDTRKFWD
jgi:hypothetical protein